VVVNFGAMEQTLGTIGVAARTSARTHPPGPRVLRDVADHDGGG
jgi:hypothetical protein